MPGESGRDLPALYSRGKASRCSPPIPNYGVPVDGRVSDVITEAGSRPNRAQSSSTVPPDPDGRHSFATLLALIGLKGCPDRTPWPGWAAINWAGTHASADHADHGSDPSGSSLSSLIFHRITVDRLEF